MQGVCLSIILLMLYFVINNNNNNNNNEFVVRKFYAYMFKCALQLKYIKKK